MSEPEVVEPLDHLLELDRDVHVDVLVEAGLTGHEGGEGGPVVDPRIEGRVLQLLLPPSQLCGLLLQFLLSSLKIRGGGCLLSRWCVLWGWDTSRSRSWFLRCWGHDSRLVKPWRCLPFLLAEGIIVIKTLHCPPSSTGLLHTWVGKRVVVECRHLESLAVVTCHLSDLLLVSSD